MARVIKCDICANECGKFSKYRLIETFAFKEYEKDICYDRIDKIKESVKSGEVEK